MEKFGAASVWQGESRVARRNRYNRYNRYKVARRKRYNQLRSVRGLHDGAVFTGRHCSQGEKRGAGYRWLVGTAFGLSQDSTRIEPFSIFKLAVRLESRLYFAFTSLTAATSDFARPATICAVRGLPSSCAVGEESTVSTQVDVERGV